MVSRRPKKYRYAIPVNTGPLRVLPQTRPAPCGTVLRHGEISDLSHFQSMLKISPRCIGPYYRTTAMLPSSSAVAKRLRNATCMSVVSFNSTDRRVKSFIVSYVGYRFITACS